MRDRQQDQLACTNSYCRLFSFFKRRSHFWGNQISNSTAFFNGSLCAILAYASGASDCAAQTNPVAIPLKFETGQIKQFIYDRTKITSIDGIDSSVDIHVEAELEILSVDAESVEATWTTRLVSVDDEKLDLSDPKAAEYLIGIPLKFTANLDGTPVEIDDTNQTLKRIFSAPGFRGGDSAATKARRELIGGMEPNALVQFLLPAPSYASVCHGTNLPIGKKREFETEKPDPFGGTPLPANGYYLLIAADSVSGQANIEWRQEIDSEAGRNGLVAGFERILESSGHSEEAATKSKRYPFGMNYAADCKVGLTDGWVDEMAFTTKVSLGIAEHIETWRIEIKD